MAGHGVLSKKMVSELDAERIDKNIRTPRITSIGGFTTIQERDGWIKIWELLNKIKAFYSESGDLQVAQS